MEDYRRNGGNGGIGGSWAMEESWANHGRNRRNGGNGRIGGLQAKWRWRQWRNRRITGEMEAMEELGGLQAKWRQWRNRRIMGNGGIMGKSWTKQAKWRQWRNRRIMGNGGIMGKSWTKQAKWRQWRNRRIMGEMEESWTKPRKGEEPGERDERERMKGMVKRLVRTKMKKKQEKFTFLSSLS
jgi:hypothetical protein